MSDWFVCFNPEFSSGSVNCVGPFLSAFEADMHYGIQKLPTNNNSTMISVCRYIPPFIKQYYVKQMYYSKFHPFTFYG